ncbi:hypothetical protein IU443_13495 [Nocardia farcinica]|uniref:Uncharacterized protein n=2 Tax=Nocardia farcinica TaxID=37329 RepID=Q5YND6_NOCFA|nr:hypothetical protein [Nocardia farcinica]MBA4857867.1 hypothetical protein [Nocardia farcinica]MBC9819065.1 hypothetical protein [Nocardia farcinica]MBF6140710.1 hypothetical protein [Nocardia farcinica]MBF6232302.1 hypothetical protein [Nocardia farcinica]MBF6255055.1 hypothetical protein [Nocardia farcinica]
MDPLSLVVGGGLVGIGWLLGRFVPRRRARSNPQLTARCGCGHDLALHDRTDGTCHAETSRRGTHGLREWVRCNCRRYTGPTPLEDVFAPPILPPEK